MEPHHRLQVSKLDSTSRAQPLSAQMKAFYTVVYDSSPSTFPEVYYPRVRYVFDDDDPELLSCALSAQHRLLGEENAEEGGRSRAILLDFSNIDGGNYEVTRASSLSADWIVTDTRLSHMDATPSGANIESQGDEPWMLVIEGVDMLATVDSHTRHASADLSSKPAHRHTSFGKEKSDVPREDYISLIRSFNIRMGLLRHLIHNSDDGQRPLSSSDTGKDDTPIQPSESEG